MFLKALLKGICQDLPEQIRALHFSDTTQASQKDFLRIALCGIRRFGLCT